MNRMSASQSFTKEEYDQRKQLHEDLKSLSEEEYKEIFRIIKRNNVPFTENSNGIHFDLCNINQETFTNIVRFLNLCSQQRENEEARTKELDTLRHETPTRT